MIYNTAYDTTACNGFVTKKTVDALQVALAHGQLRDIANHQIKQVEGGYSVVDAIQAFSHPVQFKDADGKSVIAIDVRPFGRWDEHNMVFASRNPIELAIAQHRAKLNHIWCHERVTMLRDVSPLPMAVFAAWLSESIGRRFAMDPREQLDLAILAAIFYNSLFTNEIELSEQDKLRVTNSITRACRASAEDVLNVLDQVSVINNIAHFCEAAATITKSVRLKDLNAGLLFSIVGGTWFGTNAREIAAVAIEHPPTWIAILLAAFSERSYKNSGITKVAERCANRSSGDEFQRAVLNLIGVVVGS